MSLERVIAEQQEKIDMLIRHVDSAIEGAKHNTDDVNECLTIINNLLFRSRTDELRRRYREQARELMEKMEYCRDCQTVAPCDCQ